MIAYVDTSVLPRVVLAQPGRRGLLDDEELADRRALAPRLLERMERVDRRRLE